MASKTSPSPSAITTRTTLTVSSVSFDHVPTNANDLPNDIFSYSNQKFYDYIEQLASEPLKLLCKVQGIRSMVALAGTTKDEILNEVLCYEEDDNCKEMKQ
ncbi:unnamed protein product [Didymodactylos carnosus]|uniref:Uncharacterized protein n=1 Tax=Didymodactylos carnosus TaxID=1234261 RepID=A0A8S2ULD1_9BILA|nr:unnamed protein product [Didymodactylos carnosus]